MVELAIVLPLLVLLVMGIVEFAFAFNDQLELRSMSREGARLAAVDNGCAASPSCGTPQTQLDQLVSASRGRVSGLANAAAARFSVAYTGTSVGVDTVAVCVNYSLHSVTGLFGPLLDGRTVSSRVVMRLEQAPTYSQGTDSNGPGSASCRG